MLVNKKEQLGVEHLIHFQDKSPMLANLDDDMLIHVLWNQWLHLSQHLSCDHPTCNSQKPQGDTSAILAGPGLCWTSPHTMSIKILMVAVCLTFRSMDCGDLPGVFTSDAEFLVFKHRVRARWWHTMSVIKFVIWSLGLIVSGTWVISVSLQANMSINNETRGGLDPLSKYLRFWSLLILFSIMADDRRESGVVSDNRADRQSALITHSSSKYLLWNVCSLFSEFLCTLWCYYGTGNLNFTSILDGTRAENEKASVTKLRAQPCPVTVTSVQWLWRNIVKRHGRSVLRNQLTMRFKVGAKIPRPSVSGFLPPPWTSWWVNCAIPTAHVVLLLSHTLFGSPFVFFKPDSSWKQQKKTWITEIDSVHSTKRVVMVTPQHLLVTS